VTAVDAVSVSFSLGVGELGLGTWKRKGRRKRLGREREGEREEVGF
jgi:hypothetical protein